MSTRVVIEPLFQAVGDKKMRTGWAVVEQLASGNVTQATCRSHEDAILLRRRVEQRARRRPLRKRT